jgi:hypothetical protein
MITEETDLFAGLSEPAHEVGGRRAREAAQAIARCGDLATREALDATLALVGEPDEGEH